MFLYMINMACGNIYSSDNLLNKFHKNYKILLISTRFLIYVFSKDLIFQSFFDIVPKHTQRDVSEETYPPR